ncbi:venom acid phosphatase Acph-1-like [Arctopsyche grandis]|uniref:venom acid phosphatase Acph-1-like n=1 Tax=Arctopsyche grandis TaxID=121162 RepID=UPI00406D9402
MFADVHTHGMLVCQISATCGYKCGVSVRHSRVNRATMTASRRLHLLLWLMTMAAAAALAEPFTADNALAQEHGVYSLIDEEPSQLTLVHAVFRHGDRTPDVEEMELYPDDPNIANKFLPFGLKSLTNEGKAREYQIGLFLRNRYDGFINRVYLPEEIYVRTTDYDRTKMSALACLAGLYPPERIQQWNKGLMWQPIPYHTLPYTDDDMMYYYTCPRFLEARTEELNSPRFQTKIEPYKDMMDVMGYYTGRNLTTPEEVFYIDNLFQAEKNYNIPTPNWAIPIMDQIKEMTVIEYELEFATPELRRIAGGTLLQKMITDSYNKIKKTLNPQGRKMYLYSGHENNVAAILACAGVFEPHQPPYGATFLLELHHKLISNTFVFRILYLRDAYSEAEVLRIPGCDYYCPFEQLVQLTKDSVTSNLKSECELKNR